MGAEGGATEATVTPRAREAMRRTITSKLSISTAAVFLIVRPPSHAAIQIANSPSKVLYEGLVFQFSNAWLDIAMCIVFESNDLSPIGMKVLSLIIVHSAIMNGKTHSSKVSGIIFGHRSSSNADLFSINRQAGLTF